MVNAAVRFGVMTEEALHRSCVDLLRFYEARGLIAFTHPANGGFRHAATAGRMKALGQHAGVPDLLVWAIGGVHFGIELKSDRGRLSAAQAAWMDRMTHFEHRVHVCRSLEGLQAILVAEGLPVIGTLSAAAGRAGNGIAVARGRRS
jgi:VRR-NUC domain